jgi:hypothetical protein
MKIRSCSSVKIASGLGVKGEAKMVGRRRMFLISGGAALGATAALVSALVLPATTQPATTATSTTTAATAVTTAAASQTVPRVEPVDGKRLRALLPEQVAGLKLLDAEAGKRSLGEMRSSLAQATFGVEAKPEAGQATVRIIDYIAMPGLIQSVAPWQSLQIENETDAEYSRTVTVGSHKAMEAYVKQTRSGSLNVLVAQRFVVTIEVTGLPPEALRQTARAMKLDELAAMAR